MTQYLDNRANYKFLAADIELLAILDTKPSNWYKMINMMCTTLLYCTFSAYILWKIQGGGEIKKIHATII